ncbi:MAG: hypothetical protein ACJ78I_02840, partial [Gemmatimonadaceae bacterium]
PRSARSWVSSSRSLEAAYEDTLTSLHRFVTALHAAKAIESVNFLRQRRALLGALPRVGPNEARR